VKELHLFAGAGGGILGGMLLGHQPVCAVEINPYCRRVLRARQADGYLPADMEIHDDVTKFDGTAWRGRVDVVAGGFPCQDISVAGKGAGLAGKRSGLWWEMHRIIREVGPRYVFVENVAALTFRGLDAVLGSLADLGFDAEWQMLSAADCGAPHIRKRLWILCRHADYQSSADVRSVCEGQNAERVRGRARMAHTRSFVVQQSWTGENAVSDGVVNRRSCCDGRQQKEHHQKNAQLPDADSKRLERQWKFASRVEQKQQDASQGSWWQAEPNVGRVAHGVASRVDRLRALGNGQVAIVAASAWRLLMHRFLQEGVL
jgi:DNA (cytosine-5)-methyltransferase 1